MPEPNMNTVRDERSQDYVSFIKYVAQSTGQISYDQLLILYPAICQAAMQWMLQEHKPVDFGFCLLHPSPYRANWKQIMVASFPKLGPTLLGKSSAIKEALMTSTGFFTKMLSGELLAIANDRYALWGIDLELKRSWWRAAHRLEFYKFTRLGSIEYAAYLARQIVKLRPKITSAYLSFLRQISLPLARIRKSTAYHRGYITPFVPKDRVRPVREVEDSGVDYVVARDPEKLPPPEPPPLAVEDSTLLEMSNIRPGAQDLRFPAAEPPPGK